jgi:uncharacterized protein (TIGR02996 family)
MSVWFVYRSHYDLPLTMHVKRFEEATVLEWFQKYWGRTGTDKEIQEHTRELLGCEAYGYWYFLKKLGEDNVPPPRTIAQMRNGLDRWSVEGEVLVEPHAVQALEDDDELQMTFHIFDEEFLEAHPDRAAWLTHEEWELPPGAAKSFKPPVPTNLRAPRGRWEGTTYSVLLTYEDSCSMEEVFCADRLEGVRLPQLAHFLSEVELEEEHEWPTILTDLREVILKAPRGLNQMEKAFLKEIRNHPEQDAAWDVYGDWLEERSRKRAELTLLERGVEAICKQPAGRYSGEMRPQRRKNLSRWLVQDHVAQASLHTATCSYARSRHQMYAFWVLFDDLWAGAHPELATSLLRLLDRWDVLSSPRRRRKE